MLLLLMCDGDMRALVRQNWLVLIRNGTVWNGLEWFGMVWYEMVWLDILLPQIFIPNFVLMLVKP